MTDKNPMGKSLIEKLSSPSSTFQVVWWRVLPGLSKKMSSLETWRNPEKPIGRQLFFFGEGVHIGCFKGKVYTVGDYRVYIKKT